MHNLSTRALRPLAAGTLLAGLLVAAGCGGDSPSETEQREVVYVCTQTRETVVAEAQPTPAVNPETGRRTLMKGLYCAQCETWYPAPPIDVLQRNPGAAVCPRHETPLALDGPRPDR